VDDFNMGAMENKGLNVFNTKYVLANPQTATDSDYLGIEGVIAHEYFHNWTGNRVTCRDWFQLSLKEGLTVFRDQEFSADMFSRAIQRINDVRVLRAHQFTEDAGPMAHPVRPASYLEINNFYTVTVYNKGAEVVRMYQALLGRDGFRKGMDLYFERHDGQAVTTDDFRAAMADANAIDLDQFQRWYEQSGTPRVSLRRSFDTRNNSLKLWVRQDPGDTAGDLNQPFHIPMTLALFTHEGEKLALDDSGQSELVLELREREQYFEFANVPEDTLISAFRGFSAPVLVETDMSGQELALLMACDDDAFNRWDAGQQYATQVMLGLINADELEQTAAVGALLSAIGSVLDNRSIDAALKAEMLSLPGEKFLAEQCTPVDVQRIHEVREFVRGEIATRFEPQLKEIYQSLGRGDEYSIDPDSIGKRSLKNICLAYLTQLQRDEYFTLAQAQFDQASNMTDQMGALGAMSDYKGPVRDAMLQSFYRQWSDTALVVDKWFSVQASAQHPDALRDILALEQHEAFNLTNPNRARSLIGALQANSPVFHDPSGDGYAFLADKVIELDGFNPQIASRMAGAFLNWKKLIPELGEKMKQQIQRIQAKPDLSTDVAELVNSCLGTE
jgi:aminopeptidase N